MKMLRFFTFLQFDEFYDIIGIPKFLFSRVIMCVYICYEERRPRSYGSNQTVGLDDY